MRVSVLGPVLVDEGELPLGPRDRVALAVLVARRDSPVRGDLVADVLWGEAPPPSATKVVQGCIVRLRKVLGANAIVTTGAGYSLQLHRDEIDVAVFEGLVARARHLLRTGQPDRVRFLTSRALSLWRGDPYADVTDWPDAAAEIQRLTELRRDAEELACDAALALGLHDETVPELLRLVCEEPDREHRWVLLALAQYRCGRQTEALQTLKRARAHLVADLGVAPGAELSDLLAAVLRHDPSLDPTTREPQDDRDACPYPGLASFEPEDSETFFGRGADVTACLRRLDDAGVLALVGPSGCGKSSVLRAGVAAALMADGRRVEVFTPGPEPMASLDGRRTGPGVALVVDQCEEAFTAPAAEARRFLIALVDHVSRGGWLALGIRADRTGDLSGHPELARLVEHGLILLGPLTEHGLRRAIEGPAAQAGLHVEAGLVELLVHDVLGEPAALPLLSHVLRRTWEHREGRTLTVDGYRATGGVRGAVAQTAEALFHELGAAEQEALRELMTRLIGLDDRGDLVRQRLPKEGVDADEVRRQVLARLASARLVSLDDDSIELAHESLAVAWPRLRSWLDEDVEGARIMRHLAVSAQSWDSLGRPASELYRGVRQARAAEWAARASPPLSPMEREFLDTSTCLAAAEERRAAAQARREAALNRRLRAGLVLIGGLLVLALVAGTIAVSASREAQAQALAADARRLGAEAMRASDLDTRLLLAASAVALHDDADTRASLLAALDETPALVRSARIPRMTQVAVAPRTGHILVASMDGLHARDHGSLAGVSHQRSLSSFSVVAGSTGGGAAAAVLATIVEVGTLRLPAIVLLDGHGRELPDRLGGIPPGAFAFQTISLSPDGRWLAAAMRIDSSRVGRDVDQAPVVVVWDVEAPSSPVLMLRLDTAAGVPLVVDEGRALTYLSDGDLVVRSVRTGEVVRILTAEDLRTRELGELLALSPDNEMLAVEGAGDLVLLDTDSWEPVRHLAEVGAVSSIAFSPDGTLLGVGSDELVVWRLGGDGPTEILREDDAGGHIAFAQDGSTVFTTDLAGDLLTAWDLTGEHGFLATPPPATEPVRGVPRISPDGTRILYASALPEPGLRVRDLATGAVSALIDAEQSPTAYLDSAWSPDGSLVTMTTGVERVSVWDSRTGELVARTELPTGEGATISAFTRDGAGLLVGTTRARLHLLDARTLEPLIAEPVILGPEGDRVVDNLASGPDGRALAMLGEKTYVVHPQARTAEAIDVDAFGAGWSPDGERLFVTMEDGRVGLMAADTWRWVAPPTGAQPVAGWIVTYSADGHRVVTMAGGRAGLFDGNTGESLGGVTVEHDGTAAFTADGRTVVIAEDGSRLRTWDLDPALWMESACRMAGRVLTQQEWQEHLPDRDHVQACRT
jgi:DNA-binding SARP family transcriptional activator/WD40 repeat protein